MKLKAAYLVTVLLACNWGGDAHVPTNTPTMTTRSNGEVCAKPTDCATGLTCVELRCMDPRVHQQKQCEHSEGCKVFGTCGFDKGRCAAVTDAQCRASRNCTQNGACVLINEGCFATRPAHCTQAIVCSEKQQCELRSNQCVWRPNAGEMLPVIARDQASTMYVFKTEVTQRQFEGLVGHNPSFHKDCGGDCPVERVSMKAAFQYANTLSKRAGLHACYDAESHLLTACRGFRLPTESEWQWLAFDAPHQRTDFVPWSKENSGFESQPVCSSGIQRFGLCDVLGNVWEWVHSDDALTRGTIVMEGKAAVRGGSFTFRKNALKPPSRWQEDPKQGGMTVGFRVLTTTALD